MTRVFLADAQTDERVSLRLMLLDLNTIISGEAANWSTTLAQAPISLTDMLLVDWDLLSNTPVAALEELRIICEKPIAFHLQGHADGLSFT